MDNVRIETSKGRTRVTINGKEIDKIAHLNFSVATDEVPTLEIIKVAPESVIAGEMFVKEMDYEHPIIAVLRKLESARDECIGKMNTYAVQPNGDRVYLLNEKEMSVASGAVSGLQMAIMELNEILGVEKPNE